MDIKTWIAYARSLTEVRMPVEGVWRPSTGHTFITFDCEHETPHLFVTVFRQNISSIVEVRVQDPEQNHDRKIVYWRREQNTIIVGALHENRKSFGGVQWIQNFRRCAMICSIRFLGPHILNFNLLLSFNFLFYSSHTKRGNTRKLSLIDPFLDNGDLAIWNHDLDGLSVGHKL